MKENSDVKMVKNNNTDRPYADGNSSSPRIWHLMLGKSHKTPRAHLHKQLSLHHKAQATIIFTLQSTGHEASNYGSSREFTRTISIMRV